MWLNILWSYTLSYCLWYYSLCKLRLCLQQFHPAKESHKINLEGSRYNPLQTDINCFRSSFFVIVMTCKFKIHYSDIKQKYGSQALSTEGKTLLKDTKDDVYNVQFSFTCRRSDRSLIRWAKGRFLTFRHCHQCRKRWVPCNYSECTITLSVWRGGVVKSSGRYAYGRTRARVCLHVSSRGYSQ